MTDELRGHLWSLDPEMREQLRLERVRAAVDAGQSLEATLEAEELLDENPDQVDALALLGRAALGEGDAQIAVLALERSIRLGAEGIEPLLDLAIARFEVCDLVGAAEAAREVIRREPGEAEAHWYLGLCLERLPASAAEAVTEFAAARQLEPERYPWPLVLTDEQWHQAVVAGVQDAHSAVQRFWDGLPIELHARPDLAELRAMDPPVSPAVSGLYLGSIGDSGDPAESRPEAMRLFRDNLALCRSGDELIEQIAMALESEAMGWLGLVSLDELE